MNKITKIASSPTKERITKILIVYFSGSKVNVDFDNPIKIEGSRRDFFNVYTGKGKTSLIVWSQNKRYYAGYLHD